MLLGAAIGIGAILTVLLFRKLNRLSLSHPQLTWLSLWVFLSPLAISVALTYLYAEAPGMHLGSRESGENHQDLIEPGPPQTVTDSEVRSVEADIDTFCKQTFIAKTLTSADRDAILRHCQNATGLARKQASSAGAPDGRQLPAPSKSAGLNLRELPIRFNVPASLPWHTVQIKMIIAAKSVARANSTMRPMLGSTHSDTASLGQRVRAELYGDPSVVTIVPEKITTKLVLGTSNVEWLWFVTPLKPEPITLKFSLYNVFGSGSDDEDSEYIAYENSFPVDIGFLDWAHYQLIDTSPSMTAISGLGTFLLGLAIWLFPGLRKAGPKVVRWLRREPPNDPPLTPPDSGTLATPP